MLFAVHHCQNQPCFICTFAFPTLDSPCMGSSRQCAWCLQVNYLGHWLLVSRLMAEQRRLFRQSADGTRVIFLSSVTHRAGRAQQPYSCLVILLISCNTCRAVGTQPCFKVCFCLAGKLDFGNLQLQHGYSGFKGYANSKLANILAAKEFQRMFDR